MAEAHEMLQKPEFGTTVQAEKETQLVRLLELDKRVGLCVLRLKQAGAAVEVGAAAAAGVMGGGIGTDTHTVKAGSAAWPVDSLSV